MPKIMLTDKLNEIIIEILEEAGFDVKVAWDLPKDDLPKIIGEYDAIIVRSGTKVRGDLLEKAINLKVVGRAGVGLDNLDLETMMTRGIKVVNTPAATTNSVAELALTMVLSSTRDVVKGTCEIKAHPETFGSVKKELFSREIDGKTLGLIGTGRIGTALAVKCKALGMKVIGFDKYVTENPVVEMKTSMDDVLTEADFISLHLPLNDETKHMINLEIMNKMKKGVVLINCARGGIVDEVSAHEALESGQLGYYCTDVFELEPPAADNPILHHENVIISPHIGAQTAEGNYRASVQAAERVIQAFKDQ
ncbi:MAG: hydroxyacid dehydrogenase [Candidatus Heimdallarchaeota archaeon]|nr:hydroxyacid dehydrogenase [Candidatus Heimdallarchaeota archaeon]MCK4770234.1 hydroxyacid dehydrogenase [Candidatus Heimdallarchaeota archaeon]